MANLIARAHAADVTEPFFFFTCRRAEIIADADEYIEQVTRGFQRRGNGGS